MNPWTDGRVPSVPMYPTLGAWQNRRKLASAAWVPPQWARLQLWGGHIYWYQFPELVLAGKDSDLTRITTNEDFWMVALLARASQVIVNTGSFRLQIYEDETNYLFSKYGVNHLNGAPIAQEPGLMRIPHFFPGGLSVLCRVQNLSTLVNTIDIAMFGYSRWFR